MEKEILLRTSFCKEYIQLTIPQSAKNVKAFTSRRHSETMKNIQLFETEKKDAWPVHAIKLRLSKLTAKSNTLFLKPYI